jgi:hypothetical protein
MDPASDVADAEASTGEVVANAAAKRTAMANDQLMTEISATRARITTRNM